jgi:endonuclease/exonuclease/phosphatase family metal-dependent hydrolase
VQPPDAGALRVATLNIWNRQGPWATRKPMIEAWLARCGADVVGLQEVLGFPGEPSQAAELVRGLGWNVVDAPAWDIGGGLTFGNAIVSRHALSGGRTLPLPPAQSQTRSAAFAFVHTPLGRLPVFCTHLAYELHLGHARVAQVRALAAHVAVIAPTAFEADVLPPVVVGDFNAEPDADEIRFMRGLTGFGGECVYFADAWGACNPPSDPGYTFSRDNAFATFAHEPSRRIDYVFVRGPDRALRGEPLACTRALVEPVGGVWASDHYAVVADISAAPRQHDR